MNFEDHIEDLLDIVDIKDLLNLAKLVNLCKSCGPDEPRVHSIQFFIMHIMDAPLQKKIRGKKT